MVAPIARPSGAQGLVGNLVRLFAGGGLPLRVNLGKVRLQPVKNLGAALNGDAWRRSQDTYADLLLVRDRAAHESLKGFLLLWGQVFSFVDHKAKSYYGRFPPARRNKVSRDLLSIRTVPDAGGAKGRKSREFDDREIR